MKDLKIRVALRGGGVTIDAERERNQSSATMERYDMIRLVQGWASEAEGRTWRDSAGPIVTIDGPSVGIIEPLWDGRFALGDFADLYGELSWTEFSRRMEDEDALDALSEILTRGESAATLAECDAILAKLAKIVGLTGRPA